MCVLFEKFSNIFFNSLSKSVDMSGIQVAALQVAKGVISNAQILALGTGANAATIIPAPGAGLMIRPLRVSLWLVSGAGSTGVAISGGGNLACGYTPSQTNILAGNNSATYLTLGSAALTGSATPLSLIWLSNNASPMTANSANLCDFTVGSIASASGAYSAGIPAGIVNAALELSLSAGTITNRSGTNVSISYEVVYWLQQAPVFT
jgi:hypothetical protein